MLIIDVEDKICKFDMASNDVFMTEVKRCDLIV